MTVDTVIPKTDTVSPVAPDVPPTPWTHRPRTWWVAGAAAVLVCALALIPVLNGGDGEPTSTAPDTLTLEVVGSCTPSEPDCRKVELVATGLPAEELVLVRTTVDGTLQQDGCTYDDGEVLPCFSGTTSSTGRLEVGIDWTTSGAIEVQLRGLTASVVVP